MSRIIKRSLQFLTGLAALALLGFGGLVAAYIVLAPTLPSVEEVRNVELQVPLRVYTADGQLIAEFGEMWRTPVELDAVPETLSQAFVAAEDRRYRVHPGVDYQGLTRAVWYLVRTGEKGPGGSTITMQLARNLFLTSERTYLRKLREIFLALRIERELDKDTILELYLNKIYLGQRAYGVAAAAEVYYGRPLSELTLAQQAMIAGLPKAPSAWNPIANPERARERRAYVLERMLDTGYIDQARYDVAMAAPLTAKRHRREREASAPFVAEMARDWMTQRYGREEAYTGGYQVFTTVTAAHQAEGRQALRRGLHEYDERHGYRGPIDQIDEPVIDEDAGPLFERLNGYPRPGNLDVGYVSAIGDRTATLLTASGQTVELAWAGMRWAREQLGRDAMGPNPESTDDILETGDVVYLREVDGQWRLAQIPEPQAGLVSLAPEDGRIEAIVGGYDFSRSKFNRVLQAERQPGSAFKPLIYSAALEAGLTPATLINDSPVVFADVSLEDVWRPENYSGRVFGPTRLRDALIKSRNLVSIRVLRQIGISNAIRHIEKFGIAGDSLPRNLSLALGSGEVTPLSLAQAYAVFANGGYRVNPYFIDQVVEDNEGVIYRAYPDRAVPASDIEPARPSAVGPQRPAARPADRAIDERTAWQMRSMLQDVVQEGTGRSARQLGRDDLGGKTGTTNDQQDAWFSGFGGDLVTTAWVGFDQAQTLGRYETGGRAALPLWIHFMGEALDGQPALEWSRPEGLVTVRIDPETGQRTDSDDRDAIFETFREEHLPERRDESDDEDLSDGQGSGDGTPIF